jgi:hypothetical protein
VDEGQLLMTQAERDRLVALKKAKKKLITQKQAAEEIGVTERQVRRLLRKLRRKGDQRSSMNCAVERPTGSCRPKWNSKPWRSFPTRYTGDSGRRWRRSTCTSCTRLR